MKPEEIKSEYDNEELGKIHMFQAVNYFLDFSIKCKEQAQKIINELNINEYIRIHVKIFKKQMDKFIKHYPEYSYDIWYDDNDRHQWFCSINYDKDKVTEESINDLCQFFDKYYKTDYFNIILFTDNYEQFKPNECDNK